MKHTMGIYDKPQDQQQPPFEPDHWTTNIAVFGGPMSGKTTFVKTFLIRLFEESNMVLRDDVFIIDFGGNLGLYGKLRHVCACFDKSNEENIKRVFKIIEKRLAENLKALQGHNYCAFAEKHPDQCPAHMTLIIENVNAFLNDEKYSSYQDRLMGFCRDGLSKGLSVIITANDYSGTGRLMANFGQKIAFEMPADNYYDIFNTKVIKPIKKPGRCVVNVESATYECQIFLPFPAKDDTAFIEELIKNTDNTTNPNRLLSFPEKLTWSDIPKDKMNEETPDQIFFGLDYETHDTVSLDIMKSRVIALYGKNQTEKKHFLAGMLDQLKKKIPSARLVFWEDGRDTLKEIYEEYKNCSVRFYGPADITDYLTGNGYIKLKNQDSKEIQNNPFTVFILQGKSFYQVGSVPFSKMINDMIPRAEKNNYLFVFSDVRFIPERENRVSFNHALSTAFLFDDIASFVSDKGSGDKSVFGEMDVKELRSEYAKCSEGDGYYYDIGTETLKKVKFIQNCEE